MSRLRSCLAWVIMAPVMVLVVILQVVEALKQWPKKR